MTFTRADLIERSLEYFEGCNNHDLQAVMATVADDCLMWFPAATFRYQGKEALDIHFREFLSTFDTIDFRDFKHICDPRADSICTYFTVELITDGGDRSIMRNCNIFLLDEAGLFKEVIIYNSGRLDAGFHAGSE